MPLGVASVDPASLDPSIAIRTNASRIDLGIVSGAIGVYSAFFAFISAF